VADAEDDDDDDGGEVGDDGGAAQQEDPRSYRDRFLRMLAQRQVDLGMTHEAAMTRVHSYISVGIDAAWTFRGSGRTYTSNTGTTTVVGLLSRRVVGFHCMVKRCAACEYVRRRIARKAKEGKWDAEKTAVETANALSTAFKKAHGCRENHNGLTSKKMEVVGGVARCLHAYHECGVVWREICIDGDASMEAHLKAKGKLTAVNKSTRVEGDLPEDYPDPRVCADPSHRVRTFGKDVYLAWPNTSKRNKGVAAGLKRMFSYAVRQNRNKTLGEMREAVRVAILEHAFDKHTSCGEWCGKKKNPRYKPSCRYLVEADRPKMEVIFEKHGNERHLEQLLHAYDTQDNEGIHKSYAATAPKDGRDYGAGGTYHPRIAMGVGNKNLGLFSPLQRAMFGAVEKKRTKEKERKRKPEVEAERCSTDTGYSTGMGLSIGKSSSRSSSSSSNTSRSGDGRR